MTTQPEQILEARLVAQLVGMDYKKVAALHGGAGGTPAVQNVDAASSRIADER